MKFSGSYKNSDATFLLDPITVVAGGANPAHAEALVAHTPISEAYEWMFEWAVERNTPLVARDVARVARHLAKTHKGEIVLASLACAGTPPAVLIHRALQMLGRKSVHYVISTVRNRGLDFGALDFILASHAAEDVVFIDGWTGKGFIAGELRESTAKYNQERGKNLPDQLVVLSDLAGVASFAGSTEDYLVPPTMLRCTVNGLTGPSMSNPNPDGRFDACLYFPTMAANDWSNRFVDAMTGPIAEALEHRYPGNDERKSAEELQQISQRFVKDTVETFDLATSNWVKPGVSEATRALLTRKVPMTLLVRDLRDLDVQHLFMLVPHKECNVKVDTHLPYRAAVLLRA